MTALYMGIAIITLFAVLDITLIVACGKLERKRNGKKMR